MGGWCSIHTFPMLWIGWGMHEWFYYCDNIFDSLVTPKRIVMGNMTSPVPVILATICSSCICNCTPGCVDYSYFCYHFLYYLG